jgi:predicted transposase YbfD/YdcC
LRLASALLAEMDLTGLVVTGDAQFCQQALSRQVVQRGGSSFWVVKDHQPDLRADIQLLFTDPPPDEAFGTAMSVGRHGDRQERRTLQTSAALNDYLRWPGVGQVCQIERRVTRRGRTSTEVQYAITALRPAEASPARLLAVWRGHWGIENRLHWVRDVTFDEDRCQIRTGSGPQVMAALRNTTIAAIRRAGHANVAAALRHYAAHPTEALHCLGLLPQL